MYEESTTSKQQKLLILGKERYGKTSLLHFLKSEKSIQPPPDSTDGIDISTWKMPMKSNMEEEENEIIFSCWDFAGQRVSYFTD